MRRIFCSEVLCAPGFLHGDFADKPTAACGVRSLRAGGDQRCLRAVAPSLHERGATEDWPDRRVRAGGAGAWLIGQDRAAAHRAAHMGTFRSYVRVDVSEPTRSGTGPGLAREYPGLAVHAVVADFHEHLGLPAVSGVPDGDRRLVVLLGSTIGNMTSAQRAMFLARVRSHLRPGDAFLLGTDLVKSPSQMVAAYDDSAGTRYRYRSPRNPPGRRELTPQPQAQDSLRRHVIARERTRRASPACQDRRTAGRHAQG